MPTISTSSPTLMTPVSTRPVTTVPRPEIENTSSIGIRNGLSSGRSGCGIQSSTAFILVVAADDGLRPQTIEAINHTKAAGVPMIVAINKIDKPEAKPQKVREELLQHEIVDLKPGFERN